MTTRHRGGLPSLLDRAHELASTGRRRILGITGAPGSGKGTLSEKLLQELGSKAVVVPMDGFHLAEAELHRLGRRDRKGAPDTFDSAGYVAAIAAVAGLTAASGLAVAAVPFVTRQPVDRSHNARDRLPMRA